MGLSRHAIDALRAKYAEMLAMRRAEDEEPRSAAEVRKRMGALATRFPGALREIDRLTIAEIVSRIAELETALADEHAVKSWMVAVGLFHELMRGALCAKRWLHGAKRVDGDSGRAFASALADFPFPDDAALWKDELHRIAAPPGGRVSELVYVRIASVLGTPVHVARHLAFGACWPQPGDEG